MHTNLNPCGSKEVSLAGLGRACSCPATMFQRISERMRAAVGTGPASHALLDDDAYEQGSAVAPIIELGVTGRSSTSSYH